MTFLANYDMIKDSMRAWWNGRHEGFRSLCPGVQVQVLLPAPSRGYKKDIARENPDFIGVFTVLYGKISAADFVDVNRSFSLYVRF